MQGIWPSLALSSGKNVSQGNHKHFLLQCQAYSWEHNKAPAIAPHSSTLALKIPWMGEPGRLESMGSLRVRHDWATSLSLFTLMHWRRKWQPTPVFLPVESPGRGRLVGCRLRGRRVGHNWSDLAAAVTVFIVIFFLDSSNWGKETVDGWILEVPYHGQGDFPGGSDGKASVYNVGDPGSIPGLGRSPGEGNGNPLQDYCLENPMDRGAW